MTTLLLIAALGQEIPELQVQYGAYQSETKNYSVTSRFAKFFFPPPRITRSDYSKVMFDTFLTDLGRQRARTDHDGFIKEALEFFGDPIAEGAPRWYFDQTVHVGIARIGLASYFVATETYSGGAHGNREYRGYTYYQFESDPKPLQLTDFFVGDHAQIRQNVSQLLIPKLQAMEASSVGPGGIEELTDVQCDNYVMTPYGMTWMFSPYEVASYAEGEFFVKVPWSELRPIMRRTPLMDPVPESGLGG